MTNRQTALDADQAGPLERFQAMIEAGELSPDAGQIAAAEQLQRLHDELLGYARSSGRSDLGARLKGWFGIDDPQDIPKGIYIHGEVGRGKSMLMDLFFDTAPTAAKRRVHFHAFMLEVQQRLKGYRAKSTRDPLAALAREIAAEIELLCFDEFHGVNIADAMILGRFFDGLLAGGTVIVATSNVAPNNLYEGGLQRANFLPFIELINSTFDIVDIGEGKDHRRFGLSGRQVYFTPLGPTASASLDDIFEQMTSGQPTSGRTLTVQGRTLEIARQRGGVARFEFAELCMRPLGAADYLTLAAHFHCLVIDNIPIMTPADRSAAKRFVVLIDALYEHHVKLICSAGAAPDDLYPAGDASFEFRRAASRLTEMQSQDYLAAPHQPPGAQPTLDAGAN